MGIGDAILRRVGVEMASTMVLRQSSSEVSSLPLVIDAIPDLQALVGSDCESVVKEGGKIELDAVSSAMVRGLR